MRPSIVKPLLYFMLTTLIMLSCSRLLLVGIYHERVFAIHDWYRIFTLGIRMDLILIAYFSFLPMLLLLLLPNCITQKLKGFIRWYFILVMFYFIFMELTTIPFINQYDTRPNRIFVEYLKYPKEVLGMLGKGFLLPVISVLIGSVVGIWALLKITKNWTQNIATSYWLKLILLPLIAGVLILFARSSLGHRPANPSTASFSSDQMVNSLALNSGYSLFYAIYAMKDEKNASKLYGEMEFEKALENVKSQMYIADSLFVNNAQSPLLHQQNPKIPLVRPYNLVILLQESLGAEYVGALGGLPLTPNIDALAKEGQLFTNLYATGTRSVRGIEATVTGFFPTPSRSVVKLGNSQSGFFTLADLLQKHGYETSFIYGGMATFDNMASFFTGNGFKTIIDEDDYTDVAFKGTWGVSDEDLMKKAHETFVNYGEKPFFSLVFSSSNHTPFEYPEGRITRYDKEKATVNNAIKYADYAIGEFFKMAKKASYYENTIFIVIADHNTRTFGAKLVPIHKFHIPALIIGKNVPKTAYTKLCSQLDIAPTLLDYIGLANQNPMPGRNLCQLPDSVAGRAIMQYYQNNAYWENDKVVIMQPKHAPLSFVYKQNDEVFEPIPLDTELHQKALATVVVASELYKKRTYTLPQK